MKARSMNALRKPFYLVSDVCLSYSLVRSIQLLSSQKHKFRNSLSANFANLYFNIP